ncbi:MAG: hypothetical protein ABW098_17595 [Candidatus Thiodiazotropha sp.]
MYRGLIKACSICLAMPALLLPALGLAVDQTQAGFLLYGVREASGEESVNRLLFAPGMLRIEQQNLEAGYILFNREARAIYSVTPEERTILVIQPEPGRVKIPDEIDFKLERIEDIDSPEIGGSKPQHWRLTVNGKLCRDAILAPDLMGDQRALYRDYMLLLAKQHYLGLNAIPPEYRDPCDDLVHVFAPALFIEKGLPVRVWDQQGYQQSLLDFSVEKRFSAEHFQLPKDYQRLPMLHLR